MKVLYSLTLRKSAGKGLLLFFLSPAADFATSAKVSFSALPLSPQQRQGKDARIPWFVVGTSAGSGV